MRRTGKTQRMLQEAFDALDRNETVCIVTAHPTHKEGLHRRVVEMAKELNHPTALDHKHGIHIVTMQQVSFNPETGRGYMRKPFDQYEHMYYDHYTLEYFYSGLLRELRRWEDDGTSTSLEHGRPATDETVHGDLQAVPQQWGL